MPSFHVAGVALGGIYLHFAWQAWHLWHWAGTGLALVARLGPFWSPVTPRHFAWQGVALGGIHLRFTWQAWHLATSTVVSRGRSGTWSHPPSFCVAGVALGDIHLGLYKNPVSFLITQNHVIVFFSSYRFLRW